MKIIIDPSIKAWAVEEIQNHWGEETREGIHLTDTLTPLRKYWQTKQPLKATIDDILTWLAGLDFESKLKQALGIATPEPQEWKGIKYSIDIFFNFPCEIKMRRRQIAKAGNEAEDYDWYLRQLRGYCAVSNSPQGWLIVYTPVARVAGEKYKTKSEVAFYRVAFTAEELIQERKRLHGTAAAIIVALLTSSPAHLLTCPQWMCEAIRKELKAKPHCKTCNREFHTDSGLKKHVGSVKNKDHEVSMAVYESLTEPRCKWYQFCKGTPTKKEG